MSKKVYITAIVKLVVEMDEGVKTKDVMEEFGSNLSLADVISTNGVVLESSIENFKVEGDINTIERDAEMWKLIEDAKWTSDHNYERINEEWKKLPENVRTELDEFVHKKISDLAEKFHNDWLGDPGIDVSDDRWDDLKAEVVGRGKKFYDAITVKKLRKMAKENDYEESFAYCTQF